MKGLKGISTTMAAGMFLIALVIGIVAGYFASTLVAPTGPAEPALSGEITVALMSIYTGPAAMKGPQHEACAELAIEDINEYLEDIGMNFTLKLTTEDSQGSPAVALEKIQSLYAGGVRAIVGIGFSSEIKNILSYANSQEILIVGSDSTDPSLMIADDFCFRLVPDDRFVVGAALAAAKHGGYTHTIVFNFAGAAQDMQADLFIEGFEDMGGTTLTKIRYQPETTDFSVELASANTALQDALAQGVNMDEICVYKSGETEIVTIFQQAEDYPDLLQLDWIGSDGPARAEVIKDEAGEEAAQTGFLTTLYGPAESAKFWDVSDRAEEELGYPPFSYALNVYDGLWLVAHTMLETNSYDGAKMQKAIPTIAYNYFGATGWTLLNEGGDRATGSVAYWVVQQQTDETYDWVKVGVWDSVSDTVSWTGTWPP